MFDLWEDALQLAMTTLKRPGDCEDPPASESEKAQSLEWRELVQRVHTVTLLRPSFSLLTSYGRR